MRDSVMKPYSFAENARMRKRESKRERGTGEREIKREREGRGEREEAGRGEKGKIYEKCGKETERGRKNRDRPMLDKTGKSSLLRVHFQEQE